MLNKTEENCTGCRACEKICPTHSIQMYYNSSGFLMPEVNWNKCNKCSKCINVCPENEKKELKKHYTEIYAIKAKSKEDSIDSATAGLFYMIAKKIIEKKGVVFGCIWKDKLSAIHIGTSEIKLLDKMRGSKYVQSDTKNVYVEISSNIISINSWKIVEPSLISLTLPSTLLSFPSLKDYHFPNLVELKCCKHHFNKSCVLEDIKTLTKIEVIDGSLDDILVSYNYHLFMKEKERFYGFQGSFYVVPLSGQGEPGAEIPPPGADCRPGRNRHEG